MYIIKKKNNPRQTKAKCPFTANFFPPFKIVMLSWFLRQKLV